MPFDATCTINTYPHKQI
uniref:Uncharacterized protein n=1 Tax=Talaromyces marneffei PM1 TaxID=1077442 RepID=A0A093UKD2_TALMA